MITDKSLVDSGLRGWKSNIDSADKLFSSLSPEQLEKEVAPGKNRLIYLWGHLTAVNDALLPATRDWRKTSSGIRRNVPLEAGQVDYAIGLGTSTQIRVA